MAVAPKPPHTQVITAAINASPVGILVVNGTGDIEFCNEAVLALFEYSEEQLIGQSIQLLVPSDIKETHHKLMTDFIQSDQQSLKMANNRLVQGITASNNKLDIEVSLKREIINNTTYVFATIIDLGKREDSRKQLSEVNNRFNRIVSAVNEGTWEWNPQTKEVWWSPVYNRIMGFDSEQQPDFSLWEESIYSEDKAKVQAHLAKHLNDGERYDIEYRRWVNGSLEWFHTRGNSIRQNGQVILMSGSESNISHRKRLERSLAENEHFLQLIFTHTNHAIFVFDLVSGPDFVFASGNPAFAEAINCNLENINERNVFELVPNIFNQASASLLHQHLYQCYSSQAPTNTVIPLTINNQKIWWEIKLSPIFNSDNVLSKIIGSASDISEQKETEAQLQDNKNFLEALLNNTVSGMYVFNLQSNENTYINEQYTQITGYRLEDLKQADNLLELFHPDDLPKVLDHMANVAAQSDGSTIELEYRFKHKNGHWLWLLSYDAIFRFDRDGQPSEMLGSFVDISEVKNYATKLEQSNKELENFAYLASHDLQEPLRKIITFGSLLKARLESSLDSEAKFELDRMLSASERMKQYIKDLLALSKLNKHIAIKHAVDINTMLQQILETLDVEISEAQADIQINTLGRMFVDEVLFSTLIKNIIGNAVKYRHRERATRISIKQSQTAEFDVLTIEDNGIGFDPTFRQDIFSPFKRLVNKNEYEGSGMGLAACRVIADHHNGSIEADSTPEEGSRFTICIPKEPK